MKKPKDEMALATLLSPAIAREALQRYGSAKQVLRATDDELKALGVKPKAGHRIAHLPYEVFVVVGVRENSFGAMVTEYSELG